MPPSAHSPTSRPAPESSGIGRLAIGNGHFLRYGVWKGDRPPESGCVLLLHGRTEFLEKYRETLSELRARHRAAFSFDWRGQGRSSRYLTDPHKGHVPDYAAYDADLSTFITQVFTPQSHPPRILIAHSMGGHIALRFLHRWAGVFSSAVLISPMIDLFANPSATWAVRSLSALACRLGMGDRYAIGQSRYRPPKKRDIPGNPLTSDSRRFLTFHECIRSDPYLALGGVTYGWLHATYRSIQDIHAAGFAEGIRTPILMVTAGADSVVSRPAQKAYCERLPFCSNAVIADSRHEILMETDAIRACSWERIQHFVEKNT